MAKNITKDTSKKSDISEITTIARKLSLKRIFLDWVQRLFSILFVVIYVVILFFCISTVDTLYSLHKILGFLGVLFTIYLAISLPLQFVVKNEFEKQRDMKEILTSKINENVNFSKKEVLKLKRKIHSTKIKYNRQIRKRARRVVRLLRFEDEKTYKENLFTPAVKALDTAAKFLNIGSHINLNSRKDYERTIVNLKFGSVATKQEYLQYIYKKNIDNICSSKILNSSAVAFVVCSASDNNKFADFLCSFGLCFMLTKSISKFYGYKMGWIACFKETFNTMFETISYLDNEEEEINRKNELNQQTVIQKDKKTLMEKLMNVLQKSVQTINLFTQNKILEGTSNALLCYRFSKKIQLKLNPDFYESGENLEKELTLLAEQCTPQVAKIADDYKVMEITNAKTGEKIAIDTVKVEENSQN